MNNSPVRIEQLTALRNRLNQMGDWFYANYAVTTVLNRSAEWNARRVRLRNRINARLRAVGANHTLAELKAATEAGRALAADTINGTRPFLGQFGATEIAGQPDAFLNKMAGMMYLFAVQEATAADGITCDPAGYLVPALSIQGRIEAHARASRATGANWPSFAEFVMLYGTAEHHTAADCDDYLSSFPLVCNHDNPELLAAARAERAALARAAVTEDDYLAAAELAAADFIPLCRCGKCEPFAG